MSNILTIGDIYNETQFFVQKIPKENEFAFSEDAITIVGSKVINVARVLQRLQNTVSFVGKVGDDGESTNAIKVLEKWGISVKIDQISGLKLGKIVVNTSAQGKSSIVLFKGANESFSIKDIEHLFPEIKAADGIYAATNLPLNVLYYLVKACDELKKPLFLDVPNQHANILLDELSTVSFFMPNRQEAELLLNTKIVTADDAKNAAGEFRVKIKGNIIITLDKDGCVCMEEKSSKPIQIETHQSKLVDDTASGDIFRAVFASNWLESKNLMTSIQSALLVASGSISIKGVDNTINTLFPRTNITPSTTWNSPDLI